MSWQKSIDEFLTAKWLDDGVARRTLENYAWALRSFSRWALEADVAGPEGLDVARFRRWAAWAKGHYAPSTYRKFLLYLRQYFAMLVEGGVLAVNPLAEATINDVAPSPQKTVNRREVAALLDACPDSPAGIRNRALVSLFFDTGLRRGELLSLRVGDVDFARNIVTVRRRKSGRAGWSAFSRVTAGRLRAWLEVREAAPGVEALFVSCGAGSRGEGLTENGVRVVLARLCRQAGVRRLSPHAFRRGWTVAMLEENAPVRLIQAQGDWVHIDEIVRYSLMYEAQRHAPGWAPLNKK